MLQGYVQIYTVLLAHLLLKVNQDFGLLCLTELESHPIDSNIDTGYGRWDTEDRIPAGVMIEGVICVSEKTHLTNFSCDQHAWPLYLIFGDT